MARLYEFETSLISILSYRPSRATKKDLFSENKKNTQKKYFTCMHVLPTYVCTPHVCLLNPLELELKMILSHHVDARNQSSL